MSKENTTEKSQASNFIRQIIDKDLAAGKHGGKIITRFPPEPNGFLHIGHAKAICLNFGLAEDYHGQCNLRFDDTNPIAEDPAYVEAIIEDIKWLGFNWGDKIYHASDYFESLYNFAVELIKKGLAYVDDLPADKIREYRGTLTEPGKPSPARSQSIEKNLELFSKMKAGEFKDGEYVLRAKIDLSSSNMNLRDPLIYRIRHVEHQRTGTDWVIYPLYDFTHGLSDMLEGITHSICTLEFEDHRPLYDWFLESLEAPCHPQQIEFSRLNLDYTIMSKRHLLQLVEEQLVNGWDDPRMPTVMGMRRRGYTAQSIRSFCDRIGVTKKNSTISLGTLEHAVREDLDESAHRVMCVLDPIKVIIENYPEGETEELEGAMHPKKPELGKRKIPFAREIYIDRNDFSEDPPPKYFRLKPDGQVRLRYAYVIHCHQVIKDDAGNVIELRCTYNKDTKAGQTPEGMKKVKGIIHWVPVNASLACEVRLYDRLFTESDPYGGEDKDFKKFLNPESLTVIEKAWIEPSVINAEPEQKYQFERVGYFCTDMKDSLLENLVFNRTVTLKDTWK